MVSDEKDGTGPPAEDAGVFRLSGWDLGEAAALHVRELPEEFVSRFGEEFICGYYRAFVEGRDAVALGIRDPEDGRLLGVMIGALDARSHYTYLVRQHGLRLALKATRATVKNPSLAADLVRTRLVRYVSGLLRATSRRKPDDKDPGADQRPVGFAVYVAVERGARRTGAGRKLFRAFESLCREAGSGHIEVATRPDSSGERFFTALGWSGEEERTTRSDERYVVFRRYLAEDRTD
ncbi:GNAT family N-acetyltransferase [Rubrobacter indicoceani]|uniref:GNAT family N-acetyltransferase n=1 Tax=Rubrobacter indicoceani TaxID=2051957 RepID=UPI000E5C417A|nr:GNAT family N-acetyltransferase [Rubrobacter indicoceani]